MNSHPSDIIINAQELLQQYNQENTVIIDCRYYLDDTSKGRKEYLTSHIPGAVYLDIAQDLSSPVIKGVTGRHPLPHPEILAATLRSSGLYNGSTVFVYDQLNGAYASRAWWLLNWLGHQRVFVLNGGFKSWIDINGPVDNQWVLPEKGNFKENIQSHLTVDRLNLMKIPNPLIDSRDYKRFSGEFEPIDAIAGHIPGATCIPYVDNTNSEGIWKKPEELRIKFKDINQDIPPVFYCGSGVTACHNILAYKIATGKDALLYPGSWSEWINYHKPSSGKQS